MPKTNLNVADCLRVASDYLAGARFCPSEADEAREIAAIVMADLPADLAAQAERALNCDDYRAGAWALDGIANALEPPAMPAPNPSAKRPHKPHKPRKPTLASVAKQASKAALEVARYEVKPDGSIVIVTGKGEQQQGNEVDEWIAKHADKTQRH